MPKLFISFFIIITLVACETRSQSGNVSTSLKLFKEGSDLMMQGFKLELSDSVSYRKYYEKAIQDFLSSYQLDSSNIELGTYLSFLYYKVQNFDSALVWGLKLLPIDSVNNAKNVPIAFANSLTHIGLCFLNIGDLHTGSEYLRRALLINKRSTSVLTQQLLDLSDQIYNKKYRQQIEELLQRKVNPCEYSIDIMTLALKISDGDKHGSQLMNERKKNCR